MDEFDYDVPDFVPFYLKIQECLENRPVSFLQRNFNPVKRKKVKISEIEFRPTELQPEQLTTISHS